MPRPEETIAEHYGPDACPSLVSPALGAGSETLFVLIASGLLGFASGLYFAQWQVSVESAQALAGTVTYPDENSFYIYHLKCWTLLNQLPALALRTGMSPSTTSLAVAGLHGMLGFQALACVGLAIGANRWLAVTVPLVYLSIQSVWELTVAVYPIRFVGTPHTYGSFAISWILLAVALLARGHVRSGWFMLALGPAMHLALGGWGILIAAVGVLADRATLGATIVRGWPWVLLAVALGAISFGWQYSLTRDLPQVSPELSDRYASVTAALGDTHRARVSPIATGVLVNLLFVAAAALWLGPLRRDLPKSASVLLAALLASALLAVLACWLTPWQHDLPATFARAMPGRYVNLVLVVYPAVLMGLIGAYWDRLATRAMWVVAAAVLAAAAMSGYSAMVWTLMVGGLAAVAALRLLAPPALGILLEVVAIACMLAVGVVFSAGPATVLAVCLLGACEFCRSRGFASAALRTAIPLALLAVAALFGYRGLATNARQGETNLASDEAIRQAAAGYGMLLTGSDLYLAQVRTSRPVLLCGGALDMLPYVPEAGPDIERVLAEVYGIDLFAPPEKQRDMNGNNLLPHAGRMLWQQRTVDEWRRIREDFHVSEVLVYKDWTLQLPLVAESAELRLYRIP